MKAVVRLLLALVITTAMFAQSPFAQFAAPKSAAPAVVAQPAAPDPAEAVKKYAACVAQNLELNVTLKTAREVKAFLASQGFDVTGGIFCNEQKSGGQLAGFPSEADMVKAGFTDNVPVNFVLLDDDGDYHSVALLKKQTDRWNWIDRLMTWLWW